MALTAAQGRIRTEELNPINQYNNQHAKFGSKGGASLFASSIARHNAYMAQLKKQGNTPPFQQWLTRQEATQPKTTNAKSSSTNNNNPAGIIIPVGHKATLREAETG